MTEADQTVKPRSSPWSWLMTVTVAELFRRQRLNYWENSLEGMPTLNYQLIAEQNQMEAEAMRHVTRALLVAVLWEVQGDDLSRKLSSVRFACELFYRQAERQFALEELDGYMEKVCELHPEWTNRVDKLKEEHGAFREKLRELVLRLDFASPTDRRNLNSIGDQLHDIVQRILEHNEREDELIVQSENRDTGGEG